MGSRRSRSRHSLLLVLPAAGGLLAQAVRAAVLTAECHPGIIEDPFVFGDFASTGLQTCLIRVEGLEQGESVLSVGGIGETPMTIRSGDGSGFFNGPDFGQGSGRPSDALFAAFPSLQWDTWLGLDDAPLGLSAGFPDLALAGGGGDVVGLADTAWFDADATTPEFGTGGAVVIGRFSLDEATSLQLELTIEIVESTGAIRYETHALVVPPVIPAPGGAVVLAAMLIAGRGRRR